MAERPKGQMRSMQGRNVVETTLWEIRTRKTREKARGGKVFEAEPWGDSFSGVIPQFSRIKFLPKPPKF